MRIGFLMGSFDPIHVGHINMIREVINTNLVDKVIVVVSGHNPWKKTPPADFACRVEMCRIATAPFGEKCEVSDIEGTFEPPFTANKPLNHFRKLYGGDKDLPFSTNELFIIAGADTAPKIPKWKNAKAEILPYYGVICIDRPGAEYDYASSPIAFKHFTSFSPSVPLEVSSTVIRENIRHGNVLYPLVPKEVEDFILSHKLYFFPTTA